VKSTIAQDTTGALPLHYRATGVKLKSEIVFGSPALGCQGSGICKVVPAGINTEEWKCPHGQAWVSLTKEQKIRFAFIKSSMELRQMRRFFRWHLFQVYEPFRMPLFAERRLGAAVPLIIAPGIYQVWETDRTLIVEF
jgi:hypothetical protein